MTTRKFRSRRLHKIDIAITRWMSLNGLIILRFSIGIVLFWFGFLKYFRGLSPAEDLATDTIKIITFRLISDNVILYGLATLEVLIGIGLIFKIYMRQTLLLLYIQMIGTFLPIFFFPEKVFYIFPYSLTLEGQYIVKNLVILSAGIVLGATVRGGTIVEDDLKPDE